MLASYRVLLSKLNIMKASHARRRSQPSLARAYTRVFVGRRACRLDFVFLFCSKEASKNTLHRSRSSLAPKPSSGSRQAGPSGHAGGGLWHLEQLEEGA